jgi:hypothetical protein
LLDEAITLLDHNGIDQWATWMRRGAEGLRANDRASLDYILGAYGGMGSFTDFQLAGRMAGASTSCVPQSTTQRPRCVRGADLRNHRLDALYINRQPKVSGKQKLIDRPGMCEGRTHQVDRDAPRRVKLSDA